MSSGEAEYCGVRASVGDVVPCSVTLGFLRGAANASSEGLETRLAGVEDEIGDCRQKVYEYLLC